MRFRQIFSSVIMARPQAGFTCGSSGSHPCRAAAYSRSPRPYSHSQELFRANTLYDHTSKIISQICFTFRIHGKVPTYSRPTNTIKLILCKTICLTHILEKLLPRAGFGRLSLHLSLYGALGWLELLKYSLPHADDNDWQRALRSFNNGVLCPLKVLRPC